VRDGNKGRRAGVKKKWEGRESRGEERRGKIRGDGVRREEEKVGEEGGRQRRSKGSKGGSEPVGR